MKRKIFICNNLDDLAMRIQMNNTITYEKTPIKYNVSFCKRPEH